jgi:hypothetical protein
MRSRMVQSRQMRRAQFAASMAFVALLIAVGCKKKDEGVPPQTGYGGQAGYGAQPATGYGAQAGYGTTTPPAATTPTTTPAGTTGGPTAGSGFPCQADATCLTHKCNLTVGKCAWPCQGNNDCQPGNQCMAGLGTCAPAGMPGATPTP